MRTHSVKLYAFEELSEEAQKKAVEACQYRLEQMDYSDDITVRLEWELEEKGMPTDELEYRFSYSQGDGVAWYGGIDLKKLYETEKGLFKLTPNIVKVLKGDIIGDVEVIISRNSFGHHYAHYNTMNFDIHVNGPDSDEGHSLLEDEADRLLPVVEEYTRTMSKRVEALGYKIAEGFTSNEAAKDYAIHCMDEEFTEAGGIY